MKNEYCIIGSGGLGLACASVLGRKGEIILGDYSQKALDDAAGWLTRLGIEAKGYIIDNTSRESVDQFFQQASALGTITAVVNTAGLSMACGDSAKIMNVNVRGVMNVTETALQYLEAGTALINFSSCAAYAVPYTAELKELFADVSAGTEGAFEKLLAAPTDPDNAYGISKRFVMYFSQLNSAEYGDKGVRILTISPANIESPMLRDCMAKDRSQFDMALATTPLKRFGKPYEIANLVEFLVSEKASYITACDYPCDGGLKGVIDIMM